MMKTSRWGMLLALAAGMAQAGDNAERMTQVHFEGEPETRFQANWRLETPTGERLDGGEWEGEVPQSYQLPEGRVIIEATQLSENGRLTVTLLRAGNRSRSSTQGKGSSMRLSVQ